MIYVLTIEWKDDHRANTDIEWDDPDTMGKLIRILMEELGAYKVHLIDKRLK